MKTLTIVKNVNTTDTTVKHPNTVHRLLNLNGNNVPTNHNGTLLPVGLGKP